MNEKITTMDKFIEEFTNTWNRHDPREFAELFVDDGQWNDVLGNMSEGRIKLENFTSIRSNPF